MPSWCTEALLLKPVSSRGRARHRPKVGVEGVCTPALHPCMPAAASSGAGHSAQLTSSPRLQLKGAHASARWPSNRRSSSLRDAHVTRGWKHGTRASYYGMHV